MPSAIDRIGAYRGFLPESGVGSTKSGLPQFVGRFMASEKWVEDKEEMTAFGITEPAWVDWSSYEQDLMGYLVLMTDKDGTMKEIFHMDALRKALKWDGSSFATLGGTDWSKTKITFWVEENEYQGNVSLRVAAVDDAEAPASRTIRALDASGLKDLDAKFASALKGKAAPVKAASAPAKAPAKAATPPGKAAPSAAKTPPQTTAPAAAGAAVSKATTPPKAAPKPKPAPSAPAASETAAESEGMTYEQAWAHVIANKGEASDDTVAEKWIDACTAVAPGKDEGTMTTAEGAAVATKTLELLAA